MHSGKYWWTSNKINKSLKSKGKKSKIKWSTDSDQRGTKLEHQFYPSLVAWRNRTVPEKYLMNLGSSNTVEWVMSPYKESKDTGFNEKSVLEEQRGGTCSKEISYVLRCYLLKNRNIKTHSSSESCLSGQQSLQLLIPALRWQKQTGFYVFEFSMGYRSSRTAGQHKRRPWLKYIFYKRVLTSLAEDAWLVTNMVAGKHL